MTDTPPGSGTWLDRDAALSALAARGYGHYAAETALTASVTARDGQWSLARHRVQFNRQPAGVLPDAMSRWQITPVPWRGTGSEATAPAAYRPVAAMPGDMTWQQYRPLGAYRPQEDQEGPLQLTPAQQIIANAPEELADLMHAIELVDQHLDDAGPQWAKDCPEASMYRRVGKAQLEAAEAMEELALLTGENPRKGQDLNARDRMLAELGDTAVAALLGIQSQVKDIAVTWAVFMAAAEKARKRVPAPSVFPPASGTGDQAARDNGITG